jgi:predicted ATPase/class 3 adenylate cyclase
VDGDQHQHLTGLRQAHLRRLRILEQQAAVSGINTRPEVLTEIEDLQSAIAQIDAQLSSGAEAPSAPASAPPPTPAEPRRTQATILAATLVGASALFVALDPEDAAEIIGDVWRRLDAVVNAHGGALDRRADDAVLAIWGAQAAREDDPERAVRAALAMRAALAAVPAAPENRAHRAALTLRVGISTGLVLLGAAEAGAPVGAAVTLAGRLQQAAPDGEILIAHDTYRHVRGLFAVEPRDQPPPGQGVEPPLAYAVTAAKPRAFYLGSRGVEGVETRIVGREAELARLQEAFQAVVEDRELQVVTIIGDAGVGKSRLLHAFRSWEELQPQQGWLFAGRALPERASQPYALLRDLFAFRFAIQDSDSLETARGKLERGIVGALGERDPDAVLKAHIIGQLLGFDFASSPHLRSIGDAPKQLRDRALHYLGEFVGAQTLTGPLLLVLEDMHWADDASLDALAGLLRSCQAMPVLALCLARPALFERRPSWGEGEGHSRLALEPLSKRASRQLVTEILRHAREVPAALRDQIAAAAEGNPFYVEELIKMLIDERAIVPGPEEWRVEVARLDALRVPPTLTGVLQARLDSLQPAERATLERAAVVGRIFWDSAAAHLGDSDAFESIGMLLDGLRRRELVFRHEVSAFDGASEYLFKHMLLREVTYERVLKRQRRAYHRRAAAWLIAASGERADEYAGLIAEHFERADDVPQAAAWHERAGRQAQASYASEEAIAHYERALIGLPDERRGPVLLALGQALVLTAQWEAAEERFTAALALAEASHDAAAQDQCRQALGELLHQRGDYAAARVQLEAARAGAVARGERGDEAAALRGLGIAAFRQGGYAQARALLEQSQALYRALDNKQGIARTLNNLAAVAHHQGEYAHAQALLEEGLALYRVLGDKQGSATLVGNLGLITQQQGDYSRARALYEESLSLARALGDKQGITRALHNLGIIAQHEGNFAQARALHEENLAHARALGDKPNLSLSVHSLGLLAHRQGDFAQARALYEEHLALVRATGDKQGVALTLGSLGLVAHQMGDYAQARALYEESLVLARALGDKDGIAVSLTRFAGLAMAIGRVDHAVLLAGAADALLRALGSALEPLERELSDTTLGAARAKLDAQAFAVLWARGRAMALEQAVACALERRLAEDS